MSAFSLADLAKEADSQPGFVPEPHIPAEVVGPAQTLERNHQASGIVPAAHYGGTIQGDVDDTDIRRPRLNVVQKSSKLHGDFKFGDVVLNKQVAVLPVAEALAGKSLKVLVAGARKYFQENKPYGEDARIFPTKEAVFAAGLFLDEKKTGAASKIADMYFFIEQPEIPLPEEAAALFSTQIGDKSYAPAVMTVKSIAYSRVFEPVYNAEKTFAKDGAWKFGWQLSVTKQFYDKGEAFQPILRVTERLSDKESADLEVYRPS